jgi:folylpolyglutamate synthase/dihydropteroate synthase
MLAELLPIARRVIVTQAVHPRAQDPEALLPLIRQSGPQAEVLPTVARALEHALQSAAPDDVILGCGSLFVVAEVRTAWEAIADFRLQVSD